MLLSLTYFSTATVPFSDDDLVELLERSRVRNTADDLTGMMIFHDGHFVQVLEGPEAAVRATYDRIALDPRHRDLILELEDTIDERGFPDWSMGFRDLADGTEDEVEGFSTYFRDVRAGRKVPGGTAPHVMLRAFSRPSTYRPSAL